MAERRRGRKKGEPHYKYELRAVTTREILEAIERLEGPTRERDAALLAFYGMFGRRGVEALDRRREDFWVHEGMLYVRLLVRKRRRLKKVCRACGKKLPKTAVVCPYCESKDLDDVVEKAGPVERVKHRRADHPLAVPLLAWLGKVPEGAYAFPPLKRELLIHNVYEFDWSRPMSYVTAWRVVKRALGISPHCLRHSLAVRLAEAGFDEVHLLDWFDWEDYRTARLYIKIGGGKRVRRVAMWPG